MGKCLITKLNGSVNNNELLRIGEMRMRIAKVENPTDATQGFGIYINKPVVLKIVDNGYFTDKTLTANKGKTITLNVGSNGVWVSNDNIEIAILDKYSITALSVLYPNQTSADYGLNKYFNLSDLKYSTALASLSAYNTQVTGDIVNLKNLTALTSLSFSNSQVTGDIANLKGLTALTYLSAYNTQVTGDIANLKGLTALTSLGLSNTKVTGDIANLKGLTALTSLGLSNTKVTGDIVNLKNLTRLGKELMLKGLNLSGNIGDLPNEVLFVTNKEGKGNFTWTTSSRTNILAMENIACNNIDKLLQDMSKMNANFAGHQAYHKTISLIGTHTSAADAAVQTLQSKGYTISITPE